MTWPPEPELRFRERMRGWISTEDRDYNPALAAGRASDSACSFELTIEIDDVAAFLRDPRRPAQLRGTVRCPRLGGTLHVQPGSTYRQFVRAPADAPPPDTAPDRRRILYRLYLLDGRGRRLTLSGFKVVDGDGRHSRWHDTSRLLVRILSEHVSPESEREDDPRFLAAGVLRISPLRFVMLLLGMRGRPGRRLRAPIRFQLGFLRELRRIYVRPPPPGAQYDFPAIRAGGTRFDGQPPGIWHELPGERPLLRMIVPVKTGDGVWINLHRLRDPERPPTRRPVLLVSGLAMRANSFYGSPSRATLVTALLDAGYDVWVENWRTSPDFPARDYTLDDAAVHDHPAAVRAIRDHTGSETMAAVAHCMGSASLTMSVVAKLVPEITTVVSSAVSLDICVAPRTRRRLELQLPITARLLPGVDPQWAVRPPSLRAAALTRWARFVRRDYSDPLLAATTYFYGGAPEAMWNRSELDPDTLDWISREFGYAPFSFFEQMRTSARVEHLVPAGKRSRLAGLNLASALPADGTRFTFVCGTDNEFFLPEGQRRTYERFDAEQQGMHDFVALKGYSHLDLFVGRTAAADVFPTIVTALLKGDDAG